MVILALSLAQFAFGQACTESVPVHALDQITGRIPELVPGALQASMGKTFLPILSIEHLRTRRLLILIDQSGSISEANNDVFDHTEKAASTALQVLGEIPQKMPADLSVEYGFFNERFLFGDFSSDPKYLDQSIGTLKSQLSKKYKGTAIYDALDEALHRFGATQPGDTILLLTDGGENHSKHSAGQLERAFRAAHVRLFVILLTTPESPPQYPEDLSAPKEVTSLAHNTGGRVETLDANNRAWSLKKYSGEQANELHRFWQQDVLNGYVLNVRKPVFSKEKKWRLKINKSADPKFKNVDLSYPERLLPCSAPVVDLSGK